MKAKDSCMYFLRCTNKATTTIDHSILGKVQVCQRCKERAEPKPVIDNKQEEDVDPIPSHELWEMLN